MRLVVAAFSLSLFLGAPAAPATAGDVSALAPDLEGCIRDNAAKVEAAETDMGDAVDYLVLDVCAVPVAKQREREAQRLADEQKAEAQAKCDKWNADHPKKEDAGDDNEDEEAFSGPCAALDFSGWSAVYVTGYATRDVKPPEAAALASQLILDLRLSHSTPGSSH